MERYWELDFLRGFSVVLMILFNWSYALRFLNIYTLFPENVFLYWKVFPLVIAGSFMLIAGISLSLSYNRFSEKNPSGNDIWKKYGFRGLKIFSLGLGITAVTYLTFPDNFIFFGILHLIGLSIALSPLMISKPRKAVWGSGLVLALFLAPDFSGSSLFTAALGLSEPSFSTFDYFPVVPFSAIVFSGIFLGHKIYPEGEKVFRADRPMNMIFERFSTFLEFLGRHSLVLYLIHQPVLIIFLLLLGYPVL